jgi:hypothetical protein
LNKFIRRQLEGAAVTSLFLIMIFLFSLMLSSAILFSQGVSSAYEEGYFETTNKPHEHKSNRLQAYDDPFRFPMPLGKLDIDKGGSTDERIHQNSRHSHGLPLSSGTITKQSTFKETMISDKKTAKKIIDNSTKVHFNTNAKPANLSNFVSIYQKSGSAVAADTNKTTRIYSLHTIGKDIPVRYEITGFSNNVLNMTMQPDNATLSIYMSTLSPGTFTIELPRNIMDFTRKDPHSPLGVFADRHYTSFHETENNNYTRKLTMPFNKGTSQIAIAGTHTSPEYALTTTLYGISMCIGIIALTLVARQKRFNSGSLSER